MLPPLGIDGNNAVFEVHDVVADGDFGLSIRLDWLHQHDVERYIPFADFARKAGTGIAGLKGHDRVPWAGGNAQVNSGGASPRKGRGNAELDFAVVKAWASTCGSRRVPNFIANAHVLPIGEFINLEVKLAPDFVRARERLGSQFL